MTYAAVEESSDTRRTALGTLLIERGLLDEHRLEEALRIGDEQGERLGEVLVRLGWVSDDELAKTLADQWQLRYRERSEISFDGEALRRMSHDDASRLEALPIQVDNEGVLVVALAEPTEARLMALRTLLGDNIDFVVVAKGAIEAGLRSDLLARSRSAFGQFDPEPAPAPAEPDTAAAPFGPAAPGPEPSSRSSVDSQLDSLRTLFAEVEEQRERDRLEIERLRAELADRDADLAERDESLRAAEQLLRDLADRLARPHGG